MPIWTKGTRFHVFEAHKGPQFVKRMEKTRDLDALKKEMRRNQIRNQKRREALPAFTGSTKTRRQALNAHRLSAACYAAHDEIKKKTDFTPVVIPPKK